MKIPKLSVRDLFWLVVVVAMGLAWWRTSCLLADAKKAQKLAYAKGVDETEQWIYKYAEETRGGLSVKLAWNVSRYGVPDRPSDGKYHPGLGE